MKYMVLLLVLKLGWMNTKSMLNFSSKTLFTLDQQSCLPNGSIKKGGGLCIYSDNNFSKYCKILKSCTFSNDQLEVLTMIFVNQV